MTQLQTLLGETGAKYAIWGGLGLAALIVLLLLIVVIRRIFGSSFNMNGTADRRNRPPRLGVNDFFNLDRHGRRLVIVRRDNVEHLVLIGGPNDLLIEQNIIRGLRPELPVVDNASRPTVSSRATDQPIMEAQVQATAPAIKVAPAAPQKIDPVAEQPNPTIVKPSFVAQPAPTIMTAPIVQITKPVLPVPEPAIEKIIQAPEVKPVQEPVIQRPDTLTAEMRDTPVEIPAIIAEKPVAPAVPQVLTEPPAPPTPLAILVPEATAAIPATPQSAEVQAEPVRRTPLSAFGDVTRRLEDALRRPVGTGLPTAPAPRSDAPKVMPAPDRPQQAPVTKAVLPRFSPVVEPPVPTVPVAPPATRQPNLPAEPAPAKAPPADPVAKLEAMKGDDLVLDLEQEMARLLGRTPGGGS